jgi:hypothetical protein
MRAASANVAVMLILVLKNLCGGASAVHQVLHS